MEPRNLYVKPASQMTFMLIEAWEFLLCGSILQCGLYNVYNPFYNYCGVHLLDITLPTLPPSHTEATRFETLEVFPIFLFHFQSVNKPIDSFFQTSVICAI